jgi:hypothetical protein
VYFVPVEPAAPVGVQVAFAPVPVRRPHARSTRVPAGRPVVSVRASRTSSIRGAPFVRDVLTTVGVGASREASTATDVGADVAVPDV